MVKFRWDSKLQKFTRKRRVSKKRKAARRPIRRRVPRKRKARTGKKSNIKRFYEMFSTPRTLIVQKMGNGTHTVYFTGPGPTDPIELLAKGLTLDAASDVFAQEITNDMYSLPSPDSNSDEMPDLFRP